ncbi:MAG: type I-E CRISPR-associated endonuclease Cas1 [Bryobacteraceae bacterium]|nr:type I-E CRISPR-associated endonuclease Cas1 [Bryobacteraceae bacterium]
MRIRDLHLLPKVRDSWSYLYAEHCRIDQEDKAIAIQEKDGKTPVPCAMLTLLMLGPGVTVTHAAIRTLAESGCLVMWCGEEAVRFYAVGMGETRSSRNLLAQARLWADPASRLAVVMRMYRMRFDEPLPDDLTLQQLRGREGIRIRQVYANASRDSGIAWEGRSYRTSNWRSADPVNRALSCANSCLYGLCHAAIVSAGFSPALGFIHTGKMLSFVYDIADLYKTEVSIPVAFAVAKESSTAIEIRARKACRDAFHSTRLLERIVPDIHSALGLDQSVRAADEALYDGDQETPGGLWDPVLGQVAGGVNRADSPERKQPGREDPGFDASQEEQSQW